MIKGTIDSYELWQSRPENLNENMEDTIESAENRGWNQCNRRWIETIEEQPRVGEWIPCSERLPEEDGTYLVTVATASNIRWVRTGMLYSDGKFNSEKVIAWMSLPPAYEEDANGEND